jgi:hypothetical protein
VDDAAIGRVVAGWRGGSPTVVALGPVEKLEDYARLEARLDD